MAKTIQLDVGGTFSVTQENMAGGGYVWMVAAHNEKVTAINIETETAKKDQAIGGASLQTIQIKGKAPGVSRVLIELKRPWESEAPLRTLRYEVHVKK